MAHEEYITVEEAAARSGYSVRHIRYLLKTGRVRGIKPGRDWLVTLTAVMQYKAQNPRPGRKPREADQSSD